MSSNETDSSFNPLASLLAAMDCMVWELVDSDSSLVPISAAPAWFEDIIPAGGDRRDFLSLLPYLELFIPEAIETWNEGKGCTQSDFWSQTTNLGDEVHLLALAVLIEGRHFIIVRSAHELYEERQRWQLYAHETTIQLKVIERLKGQVEESARALSAANDQLSELSIRDALTGLFNRRHFDKIFDLELSRAMRGGEPLSLLFMDIDKFKLLNDTYGHSAGDDCLRAVGRLLRDVVRRPTDMVARFGGEEFAILLPATDGVDALQIANSINRAIRALEIPNKGSEVCPFVTASLGVYTRQPDGDRSTAQIIEAVDAALYRAKHEGRNRAVVAAPHQR